MTFENQGIMIFVYHAPLESFLELINENNSDFWGDILDNND